MFEQPDLDEVVKLTNQATSYEGIGALVEEELIDIKLVDLLSHNNILRKWETFQPLVTEMRRNMEKLGFITYPSSTL